MTPESAARRDAIRARCGAGFTLVEVLVSLIVISIGLLGVAKLVLAAVKANDSAYLRGQATVLAYAILDDMRANRAYALQQGYATSYGPISNPGITCVGIANTCTPAQLAQYQIYLWKQRLSSASTLKGALPGGDGQIAMAVGANNEVTATITVRWDDSVAQWAFGTPSTSTPNPMTYTLVSVL